MSGDLELADEQLSSDKQHESWQSQRHADAPVSKEPAPENEQGWRRFLFGSSTVALLVAGLDQDVVKQWRIKKYRSASKVDPEYLGPDVRSQSMYLFLDLQLLGTLAAVVIGFAASAPSADSWGRYQNFYGLVVNSGVATTAFSVLKMFSEGRGKQIASLPLVDRVFLALPFAVLLPPLLTHILPAVALYYWLVVCVLASLRLAMAVRSGELPLSFLDRLAPVRALSPKLRAYFVAFGTELVGRFVFIFVVQTTFNYAALFYADPTGYAQVISTDLRLRSQTQCFFQHSTESSRGWALLLSFF
jgi:hypothetical protein